MKKLFLLTLCLLSIGVVLGAKKKKKKADEISFCCVSSSGPVTMTAKNKAAALTECPTTANQQAYFGEEGKSWCM